jgi:hypothetical protein
MVSSGNWLRRGLTRLRITRHEAREARKYDDAQRVDLAKRRILRELRKGFGG